MAQQLLSASNIFEANDLKEALIDVPEWPNADGSPGKLRLLEFTTEHQIQFQEAMALRDQSDGPMIILIFAAVDDERKPLFAVGNLKSPDAEEQAAARENLDRFIRALKQKSFGPIRRIQREALLLNGMGKEGEAAAKNS